LRTLQAYHADIVGGLGVVGSAARDAPPGAGGMMATAQRKPPAGGAWGGEVGIRTQ
jgi:hypothetical protein